MSDDEVPPAMITVFLVDDHEVVRRGLADMLNEEPRALVRRPTPRGGAGTPVHPFLSPLSSLV